MKNKRQYESRVKRNAAIIYFFASVLCVGMIYYISNLKKTINFQENNITKNEKVLRLTNNLIENVNEAQSLVNIYSFSSNNNCLNDFNVVFSKISNISDSIVCLCDDDFNKNTLNEIKKLLFSKKQIVLEIAEQNDSFNPYQEIYSIINNHQPKQKNISVSKTINDTIIYKTEKKGFFKRLYDVFNPDSSLDSLVLVTNTTIDTIMENNVESYDVLTDIRISTEKGRKDYIKQIQLIESRYNNLILSDQYISKEISELLIVLHEQTLNSVIDEINKSELLINKNINLSIAFAMIALFIILTFIILIFHDVKKVASARKATEEAKKKTEEIMESRHKLLLSVSHDIKAPLSSILGYLELMQMNKGCEDAERQISSMKNSAEHILSLLTNLLNYSRIDQGKESVILSDFNISKLCDDLNAMFKPLAENKHLSFIYENKLEHDLFIKSDALKIKQIVSNLLSNAIKYTIKGRIDFVVDRNEKEMIFVVADQGIGIPKDKLEEIYKPFNRIDNKESLIEGNGFGLFVVKGLVDLLGGTIDVESEIEQGSSFRVSLPVEFVESVEYPNVAAIRDVKLENDLNVLVVDDDNSLLSVIESMINKIGKSCVVCHFSFEFERCCENLSEYDIVITDREMGAFSGLDVLKTIKEIDRSKKVILMTARSEYNDDVVAQKGFDGYLRKPFSIKDLADILNANVNFDIESRNFTKYNDDFPDLCLMFDNDIDAIEDILRVFVNSTSDNMVFFNEIIDNGEFDDAVGLCHKMYPMFVQLNQKESVEFLRKMDGLRGRSEESFPEWKEESIKFMSRTDDFLSYLLEKYGIG